MEEETVSSFLIGKLHDLLVNERVYLRALTDVVDELAEMLTKIDDLIEHAHVRRDKRTSDIIEKADHMIDSIEMYVLRVVNKHTIRARLLRPKLILAIENLTTKIREYVKSQSREESSDASLESRREYKVQDLSGFNEKDFIGREEDIMKLVSYLVDHQEERFRIISIYGMGGLGKTTLARKIYKNKKVLRHFQSFAFVCVSEQCHADEILKHILQQLLMEEDMKGISKADVIESLQRVLGEKMCLVIVDDIWSVHDWEKLNCGLLGGSTGSKLLLTTRIKDVAEKGFCYSLECLSEDECWELCRNKLSACQDSETEKRREELGRKMISWCGGNPLAVLVLRGVLVTKGSLWEWKRFYDSRTREGDQVYKQFKDEVAVELMFSYNELPYPLKPCFLYMATFVEDEEIDVEMLYMLWEAEGIILSKDREVGETMMDLAERYLGELVGRCLIEAEFDDNEEEEEEENPHVKRRYKSCRLHDLMRQLCLSLVKKQNFLKVQDYHGHQDKILVLQSSFSMNDTLMIPPRQVLFFSSQHQKFIIKDDKYKGTRYVRSLMFNGGCARKLSKLKKLNLVRVLSFNHVQFEKERITNKLIHLRYLSLRSCSIDYFSSSIYKFIYLQTLDMRAHNFGFCSIPSQALRKLERLKHLFLPEHYYCSYEVTPAFSKLRLDGLTKLETLVNLDSRRCEMKDIINLTSLRRLEMRSFITSEDDGEEMKEIMNNVNLDRLRHSSLTIDLMNPKVEIYSDALRGQLPEDCKEILQELYITGVNTGKFLPEFSNYNRLTILSLLEFEVEEDPIPTLEKLPNLKEFRLIYGKLLKGNEMAFSATGFPKLKILIFRSLEYWEKWCVEEGAMPNLRCLWIHQCLELEMLPDALKFITTLEELYIWGMPEEFKRRFGAEESDLYKIRRVNNLDI